MISSQTVQDCLGRAFAPTQRGRPSDDPGADGVQRLFLAALGARWAYTAGDIAFAPYRAGVRQARLCVDAERSEQQKRNGIGGRELPA